MGQLVSIMVTAMVFGVIALSCAGKSDKQSDPEANKVKVSNQNTSASAVESLPNKHSIEKGTINNQTSMVYNFKYDLSSPKKTAILNSELIEISALSFDAQEKLLYAINDEKGTLFSLDPVDGRIIGRLKFGKRGDYEGVELTDEGIIYTLKSNGNMVAIDKSDGSTSKIKTGLKSGNDVEGLGYNKDSKLLLLACKGSPNLSSKKNKSKHIKAVYGWSTVTKSLIEDPILTISDEALLIYLKEEYHTSSTTKSNKKKLKKRVKDFSPSGIAYNPVDKMYYIISSVGKMLIVVNEQSEVLHIDFLDSTYFSQPEGICFGEDNAMYISNEGRGLVAKLMKFELLK